MFCDFLFSEDDKIPMMAFIVLLITALIWCIMFVVSPDTWYCGSLFFGNAEKNFFNDFFMTRAVARMPVPYAEACCSEWLDYGVGRSEQCYPALANYWVGMFPENLLGAVLCTVLGVMIYVWGLIVFFRKLIPGKVLLATSVACCSAPFLFAFGVGNMIFYATGFSLLFLTWYDSASTWRKCAAALAFALAAVLKISPVLLGVLYLGNGWSPRFRYAILASVAALVLFVVPFAFCGGYDSFKLWVDNAAMNSLVHSRDNGFGLFGFVSELIASFSMGGLTGLAWGALRVVSSCLGLIVLVLGCRFGNNLWDRGGSAVIGVLFVPPVMLRYAALYIVPFTIAGMWHKDDRIRRISAAYCLSLCLLFRIPLLLGSANVCLAAAASVDMAVALMLTFLRNGYGHHARD